MMKYSLNRRSRFFAVSLPVSFSFLLCSCKTDFTSVEDFVNKNQAGIKTSSDILAQDIYDSCVRRANYLNLTVGDNIELRKMIIQDCNSVNKPNVKNFQQANRIILGYMTNLGQVASGKTVSFDKNISDLQTALTNLKIGTFKPDAPTVQAGTNILRTLVNVFSKSERGKALKKAILCSDDSFQTYITGNPASEKEQPPSGGLIEIAQDAYMSDTSGILGIEKTQIESYYQTYFAELGKLNPSQISTQLEVQKDYTQAMEIVQSKSDNAQSYINTLQATAKAHHQLKNDFIGKGKDAINPSELKQLCQSVLAGKVSNLEKSKDAAKLNINQQQLSKAQIIITEYLNTVKTSKTDSNHTDILHLLNQGKVGSAHPTKS